MTPGLFQTIIIVTPATVHDINILDVVPVEEDSFVTMDHPESLRRIAYVDAERKKRMVFLTDLFNVPSQSIADTYRKR